MNKHQYIELAQYRGERDVEKRGNKMRTKQSDRVVLLKLLNKLKELFVQLEKLSYSTEMKELCQEAQVEVARGIGHFMF